MTTVVNTDYEKWRKIANNEMDTLWSSRGPIIVKYINPGESVLDVGSGNRNLQKVLPEKCSYQPMDCVSGDPSTILVDFNKNIIPVVKKKYDVIVCSGVLEYIHDPKKFLMIVKKWGKRIILSYATVERRTRKPEVPAFNDLSTTELLELFAKLQLDVLTTDSWNKQTIFILKS